MNMKMRSLPNVIKYTIYVWVLIIGLSGCAQQNEKETVQKAEKSSKKRFYKTPLPELQLDFVNTRYQAYFHYNMATFNNVNSEEKQGRAYGKVPPTTWAPTGLDTDQWAKTCIDAGMTGGWLTTKHHGGFCLWDSEETDYDVASSNVKTDVVKSFVDSFRKAGLKVGLYYSILDYHHEVLNGSTSRKEIEFTKNQIRELLTNYGPIDYINFDGWSSWPTNPDFDDMPYGEIYELVKSLQPNCLIVNHTYESNLAHAEVPFADAAGRAYPYNENYMRPTAASDFIQRGWWWDNNNGFKVAKSVDYLLKQLDSYNSHNSVYILNLSPNPNGRIDDDVIERLNETAAKWQKPEPLTKAEANWGFGYDVTENLAFLKPCSQSTTHPYINDKRAYPRADIAVDGVTEGVWEMEQTSGTKEQINPWWRVDLGQEHTINEIQIFNTADSTKVNMTNFEVAVLDAKEDRVWSEQMEAYPDPSVAIKTSGVKGRFVKIKLLREGSLRLAEVIVK